MNRRCLTVLALLLLSLNNNAATDELSKAAQYSNLELAQIKAVHELSTRLDDYGLSWEDIEESNLPFEAESYEDCLEKAELHNETKQEQDIADAQCLLRYTPAWAKPETDQSN